MGAPGETQDGQDEEGQPCSSPLLPVAGQAQPGLEVRHLRPHRASPGQSAALARLSD